MSDPPAAPAEDGTDAAPQWSVRNAAAKDLPEVARVLAELLIELGGSAPARHELEAAAALVLAEPEQGCLLVADAADESLVGVLAASFQHAIHIPGRYCILQDLWTDPSRRSEGIGAGLLAMLLQRMREQEIRRVEVGLPPSSFSASEATEAFYRENGFVPLGPRMRQLLP
jgi:GNAT superfamily N-acetyltransferase